MEAVFVDQRLVSPSLGELHPFEIDQFLQQPFLHRQFLRLTDIVPFILSSLSIPREVAVLTADALALGRTIQSILKALAVLLPATRVLTVASPRDVDHDASRRPRVGSRGAQPDLVRPVFRLEGGRVLLFDHRNYIGTGLVIVFVQATVAVAVLAEGKRPEAFAVEFDALGLLAVATDLFGSEVLEGSTEDGGVSGEGNGRVNGRVGLGGTGDWLGEQTGLN